MHDYLSFPTEVRTKERLREAYGDVAPRPSLDIFAHSNMPFPLPDGTEAMGAAYVSTCPEGLEYSFAGLAPANSWRMDLGELNGVNMLTCEVAWVREMHISLGRMGGFKQPGATGYFKGATWFVAPSEWALIVAFCREFGVRVSQAAFDELVRACREYEAGSQTVAA